MSPITTRLNPMGNRAPADYAATAEDKGGKVKSSLTLSTDFANPTGETLTAEERDRVLDLAEALDIALIEDGAYQSLRL